QFQAHVDQVAAVSDGAIDGLGNRKTRRTIGVALAREDAITPQPNRRGQTAHARRHRPVSGDDAANMCAVALAVVAEIGVLLVRQGVRSAVNRQIVVRTDARIDNADRDALAAVERRLAVEVAQAIDEAEIERSQLETDHFEGGEVLLEKAPEAV